MKIRVLLLAAVGAVAALVVALPVLADTFVGCPGGGFDGNVEVTGDCTIPAGTTVTGNVKTDDGTLNVHGTVNGNVEQTGSGGVEVSDGGRVDGNIVEHGTGNVTLGDTASVNGNVTENGDGDVILGNPGSVSGNVTENGDGKVTPGNTAPVDGNVTGNGDGDLGQMGDNSANGNLEENHADNLGIGVEPGAVVTKIDLQPPAKPLNFKAKAGDHKVTLTWKAVGAADLKQYVVTRTSGSTLATVGVTTVAYRGKETKYVDRKLKNKVEYRYEIAAHDKSGNRSAVATVTVTPRALLLAQPRAGAKIRVTARSKKVKFRWAPQKKANYYNIQLFRIKGKGANAEFVKVGTFWPGKANFTLKRNWTLEGKRYKLRPGWRMVWYVWPGFGKRLNEEFGDLIGQSNFKVLKVKKAAKAS